MEIRQLLMHWDHAPTRKELVTRISSLRQTRGDEADPRQPGLSVVKKDWTFDLHNFRDYDPDGQPRAA